MTSLGAFYYEFENQQVGVVCEKAEILILFNLITPKKKRGSANYVVKKRCWVLKKHELVLKKVPLL